MVRLALSLLTCCLAAAAAAGCSEQSNSAARYAGSAAASTAAQVQGPVGPFPRGAVDASHALDPATQGPKITVLTPLRGALVTVADVRVAARVVDVDGVRDVVIGGRYATHRGGDQWEAMVTLQPGVNFVTLEATDDLGNTSRACFSLTHGAFHSDSVFLERSVTASLRNSGIAKLLPLLDGLTANLDAGPVILAKNPLHQATGVRIEATSVQHGAPRYGLQGVSGGARVTVTVPSLELKLDVKTVGITTRVTLAADRVDVIATLGATATPPQPGQTALGLEVQGVRVVFDGFRVNSSGAVRNWLLSLLRGKVKDKVSETLEDLLATHVITALGTSLPGIDKPLTVSMNVPAVGPTSLDVRARLSDADGSPTTGVGFSLGVLAQATQPVLTGAPTQFLVQGIRTPPAVTATEDLAVFISADAANALLHAFWLAGGMDVAVDGASPGPGRSFMTARMLYPFFPAVEALAPHPDTPLRMELSAAAAPVVAFGTPAAAVEFTAGEVEVTCLLDYMDGDAPLALFTLRIPMQVEGDVAIVGRELVITDLRAPQLNVDLLEEPAVDLPDDEIERFMTSVMPILLERFRFNLPPVPIPGLPFGIDFDRAWLEAGGGVLAVRADLK